MTRHLAARQAAAVVRVAALSLTVACPAIAGAPATELPSEAPCSLTVMDAVDEGVPVSVRLTVPPGGGTLTAELARADWQLTIGEQRQVTVQVWKRWSGAGRFTAVDVDTIVLETQASDELLVALAKGERLDLVAGRIRMEVPIHELGENLAVLRPCVGRTASSPPASEAPHPRKDGKRH